jgi:hypothetical protein
MTTPADIRRHIHRVINSANILEARLPHGIQNTTLRTADGYPTKASGSAVDGSHSTSELTPTESAAEANLGDIYGYTDGERDNITGDDTRTEGYKPGPTTRLADLADELRAALASLDRAHIELTNIGVPPLFTDKYRCRGINGTGCTDWADSTRIDNLCIDCGRASESNKRRVRRHKAAS